MLMCLTLLFHAEHFGVVTDCGLLKRYAFQGAEVSTKFGLMEVGI